MPRVPPGGLLEDTRKQLNHKRECANQILKASMSINNIALAEMEVPESYLEALPKVCNSNLTLESRNVAEESLISFHMPREQ